MNRTELVDAVGERLGDRRTAAVAVEAVLDAVTTALADGEKVSLFGFGVFEKVDRAARTARNPATGGTVEVPATAVPRFRPGQALKDAVNGRSSVAAQRRATASGAAVTRAVGAKADSTEPSAKADGKKAEHQEGRTARRPARRKADGKKAGTRRRTARRRTAGRRAPGSRAPRRPAPRRRPARRPAARRAPALRPGDGRPRCQPVASAGRPKAAPRVVRSTGRRSASGLRSTTCRSTSRAVRI